MTIAMSMKVVGEIVSLTTWKEFVGVGSTEAQLFHLEQNVRMLLCDEDDPIEVLMIDFQTQYLLVIMLYYALMQAPVGTEVLLSFIDESGLLATANYGGSKIEFWTVPQDNIPQVLFKGSSSDSMDTVSPLQLDEPISKYVKL